MKYADLMATPVPQSQPLNKRQVENNAGGFVFQIDKWSRLDRFLVLGSDSPTYYQKAQDLTKQNAACVIECFNSNVVRTIDVIVSVSEEGRAPKNDAAIFAMALGACHEDVKVRALALAAMPAVCRTSTHLFQFVDCCIKLGRGWGRTLKRAVAQWYGSREVDSLAYQVIKYRQRENYTHKRLMQTAHPDPGKDKARVALYKYLWEIKYDKRQLPKLIGAHLAAMDKDAPKKQRLELVREFNLPWEALPTECNTDPDYWEAMLPKMGYTALMRNLGNMSRIGLVRPLSAAEMLIKTRLVNEEDIRKSKVHPFNILQAMSTYSTGKGFRGGNSWPVSQPIVAALDKAFYKAFKNVVPTGKRHLLALDVSGSMSSAFGGGSVSCCQATAALALLTLSVEPWTHVVGFHGGSGYYAGRRAQDVSGINPLEIHDGMSLKDAMREAHKSNFGSTDCALPMLYALQKRLEVDVFVVMTDNETWAGNVHPMEALKQYRKQTGIKAKLIVVGMTSTGFSIADPKDGGALDVVGFDSAAPAVMADFARK